MDPKTMKLLGLAPVMAPNDAEDGAGGGDHTDDDDRGGEDDDGEEDREGDDDDDESEDDADHEDSEDDEEEDDADDDDDEDEGDDELGKRAQTRIRKLVAKRNAAEGRVKQLEDQLAEAKKLSGDDGKAILRAAEVSGILPGLMSKDEAEAFQTLEQYPRVIDNYQDWLDEHGPDDEYGSGEHAMSYGQVKKRVRQLEHDLSETRQEYGDRRKELRKKVREIFEAGVEALKEKAKSKPKDNGKGKPKAKKTRDDEERREKKYLEKPDPHGSRHTHREARPDDMDVDNDDDLEAYIRADLRRKSKK